MLGNEEKAREISHNARLAVEKNFTIGQMVKKTEDIYRDLIEKKIKA